MNKFEAYSIEFIKIEAEAAGLTATFDNNAFTIFCHSSNQIICTNLSLKDALVIADNSEFSAFKRKVNQSFDYDLYNMGYDTADFLTVTSLQ